MNNEIERLTRHVNLYPQVIEEIDKFLDGFSLMKQMPKQSHRRGHYSDDIWWLKREPSTHPIFFDGWCRRWNLEPLWPASSMCWGFVLSRIGIEMLNSQCPKGWTLPIAVEKNKAWKLFSGAWKIQTKRIKKDENGRYLSMFSQNTGIADPHCDPCATCSVMVGLCRRESEAASHSIY